MKKILTIALFASMVIQGCTNVDEQVYDKYNSDDFYSSPAGANVALANVYSQIPGNWGGVGYAGADNGWYDLNSMSSDEQVVPHRNTGDWQLDFAQLYLRKFLPDHTIVTNTWNWLYASVFRANLAVDLLQKANADESKIAEAKVLRAFFYYLLMDDYGNVPFYTSNNITVDNMPQKSRKEVFDFVVSELKDNIDKLSITKGGSYYGRFNKWAGYALLAKVYLNAEVYTGTPMWNECIAACDKVSEGGFTLHSSAADVSQPLGSKYYELFGDVCPDDETILAIYTKVDVVGRNIFTVRSFGGNDGSLLLGFGAWNGSVIPADYIAKFDDNDIRKRQFRYGANPYGPQLPGFINYSLEVTNIDNPGANPNAGARSQKFWPAAPANSGGASNDFPIYRYADIMLMKAECLVRTSQATLAKPLVDAIRTRAGVDALSANPTLTDIYNERGFELTWEGHRRQDMIRFGTFTQAHGLVSAVDKHFNLFPIPTSALNANPKLVQNPNY
ncbi:RagB/SusD family nutrient uptake outer membrane protein [uncultured Bacteroides sp.]|uniref:RagB/SusD family nutrient uptake outer membrane protein n=1 Tax=uncultured Bacteroides sp. TaxID=162156 RepID=UPI002AA6CB60|nr:RagB/SusD family nutrient uptake outer membrane protein [uncultured Bacteroides sp.]